jgi:hypothetical protein
MAYANGEVRREFSICYAARNVGGEPSVPDGESTEVRVVPISKIDQLAVHRSTRFRLQHFSGREVGVAVRHVPGTPA